MRSTWSVLCVALMTLLFAGTGAAAQSTIAFEKGSGPNLAASEADFAASDWRPEGLAVTAAAAIAPDQTSTAYRLTESSGSDRHRIETTIHDVAAGTTNVLSVYVKPAGRNYLEFEIRDNHPGKYGVVRFDLAGKAVSLKSGDVAAAGVQPLPDGWLRCWAAMPYAGDTAVANFALMDNEGAIQYPAVSGAGLLIWGVQFEPGTQPAAYSPGKR